MQCFNIQETLNRLGGRGGMEYIITPEKCSSQISLVAAVIKSNMMLPSHSHEFSEDCIFLLSGQGTFKEDKNKNPVCAGQVIWVPEGVSHSLSASQKTDVVELGFLCPPDPARHPYLNTLTKSEKIFTQQQPASNVKIADIEDLANHKNGAWQNVFSENTGSRHLTFAYARLNSGENLSVNLGELEGVLVVLQGKACVSKRDVKAELKGMSAIFVAKHTQLNIVSLIGDTTLIIVHSLSGVSLVE